MSVELTADFLADTSPRILGDTFYIGLAHIRNAQGTDISDDVSSATVIIYDSTGATTLAENSLLLTGTKYMMGSFRLTTGSGKIITAAGTYRAVYRVLLDTLESKSWEQNIVVKTQPF